jgi:hypothetical protein
MPDDLEVSMPAYRPIGMQMWDAWGITHGNLAHLFYLQRPASDVIDADKEQLLGHATSKDLLTWTEEPAVLSPAPAPALDDLQLWTGCVVRDESRFRLFYTMRSSTDTPPGSVQRIGMATSTDLVEWRRSPANPVITPDPRWYSSWDPDTGAPQTIDCRDLVVIVDPAGGWLGFYACRVPGARLGETAAIACVHSDDLENWEHLPPALSGTGFACLEVPDVFEIDGTWYMTCLTGNQYGNRGPYTEDGVTRGTIYAKGTRPQGPYLIDDEDSLLLAGDATTGYSCRAFEFGGERLALYTEPSLTDTDTLSTPKRLVLRDGRLRLARSTLTESLRTTLLPLNGGDWTDLAPTPFWPLPSGSWRAHGDLLIGKARDGWQPAVGTARGLDIEVEGRFRLDRPGAAGFLLHHNPDAAHADGDIAVLVDTARHRVSVGIIPELASIVSRPLPTTGQEWHLRLVRRATRCELFVDDILILQLAIDTWRDDQAVNVGLVVENAAVEVSDLRGWTLD